MTVAIPRAVGFPDERENIRQEMPTLIRVDISTCDEVITHEIHGRIGG
jgi:hypothetical protein